MKNENHIIADDEAREAELKRTTMDLFKECGTHIAFIENHPILRDTTYSEILKDSRGAFKQALAGLRMIGSDPYEANGAIALALMHLKSQHEMLERLLAQDCDGATLAAVQDVAHDVRAARADIADSSDRTQNMIHQKFQELEQTKDQVAYLAGKKTTRSINGKKAQAKANADPDIDEAKQRAAGDMARAVDRVRERVLEHEKKNEKYNLLAICRTVSKEFTPLTKKKNALGKFEGYAPLMDWQGNPIQPDTLRKNYTKRFGTKKTNKSQDQVKPKTSAKSKVKRTTK